MRIDLNLAPQPLPESPRSSTPASGQAISSSGSGTLAVQDQAQLSGSHSQVLALVAQASQFPEVRAERIQSCCARPFKAGSTSRVRKRLPALSSRIWLPGRLPKQFSSTWNSSASHSPEQLLEPDEIARQLNRITRGRTGVTRLWRATWRLRTPARSKVLRPHPQFAERGNTRNPLRIRMQLKARRRCSTEEDDLDEIGASSEADKWPAHQFDDMA